MEINSPQEYSQTPKGYSLHKVCGRLHVKDLPCMRRIAIYLTDPNEFASLTDSDLRFVKAHNLQDRLIDRMEIYLYGLDWTYGYLKEEDF